MFALAGMASWAAGQTVTPPAKQADRIVVEKSARTMSVLAASAGTLGGQRRGAPERAMPFGMGSGMTRHPNLGAVERRPALEVNHREIRNLEKQRRSGALQGALR